MRCHGVSKTARFPIADVACEKFVSDLGLGGGFRWILRFPPLLITS